ncbi:MAG: adenine phosphoribosyltransferase [Candidatus Aenigmarchaeota archaeon]|nr:adenine phosphoribosyltransferase [Candidatus Aenigmarchaeota archaeon]
MENKVDLRSKIRTVPDFPKKGIMFKDITTLLQDANAFRSSVKQMMSHFDGRRIDKVVSAESRGFILGSAIAYELGAGFVPLRKPGKLPWKKLREEFDTEYSKDAFEIHEDAIKKGETVLIVDDLLATGGTLEAATKLVERLGGNVVGISILIELSFLKGREKLKGYDVFSVVNYDAEE